MGEMFRIAKSAFDVAQKTERYVLDQFLKYSKGRSRGLMGNKQWFNVDSRTCLLQAGEVQN